MKESYPQTESHHPGRGGGGLHFKEAALDVLGDPHVTARHYGPLYGSEREMLALL